MKIIPYDARYRDDMIFMVLQAKDALGRVPRLNEDLLDVPGNYLDRGDGFWLALDERDRVIGCVGFSRIPGTEEAFLHRLYVKAAEKRKGIGSALLEMAEEEMQRQGIRLSRVHLGEPREQWFESYAFYAKHGYQEYAERYWKKVLAEDACNNIRTNQKTEKTTEASPMRAYSERLAAAQTIIEKLLDSKKFSFDGLKPSDLEDGLHVVYAIFDKADGSCLYVGRTKNLRQRLYTNHLMGPKSNARLKKYLAEDEARPDIPTMEAAKIFLKDRCYFQYLPIQEMRERGQIEGLLSYILNVQYIHEEH